MDSANRASDAVGGMNGDIVWSVSSNLMLLTNPSNLSFQFARYTLPKPESKIPSLQFQQYVTEDQANPLSDYDSHSSLVAALGVLIPVSLVGDIVDPMATKLSLNVESSETFELVNNKGERIGEEQETNQWQLGQDELTDVYLSNISVGQHDFTLTSIAEFSNGSIQKNVINVELNVLDANNSPLGYFIDEQVGIDQVETSNFSDNDTLVDQDKIAELEFIGELFDNQLFNDVFVWNMDEHGSLDNLAIDIITDFKPEDRVNLSELLEDEHQGNFTDYLHIEYDASNDQTVLAISNDGQFDGTETSAEEYTSKANHEIVIEHVNLVGNAGDQATVIENLIANQQLVVNA